MRTMERDDTWEPEENLIEWAKQHFASVGIGGVWSPDESGCTYVRQDEDTFALMRMTDHPTAFEHHRRFVKLFEAAGVDMIEGDGFVKQPAALTPEQNSEQRYKEKQEIAKGWKCECSLPLANFDLKDRTDKFFENKDVLLSNGETTSVELWGCVVVCPSCENEVSMDPDDYNLLAGDELFMQWRDSVGGVYVALTRMQMKEMADAGITGVVLGTLSPETDDKVPPWMWGTYNLYRFPNAIDDMTEEEHAAFIKAEEEGATEQQRLIEKAEGLSTEEEFASINKIADIIDEEQPNLLKDEEE